MWLNCVCCILTQTRKMFFFVFMMTLGYVPNICRRAKSKVLGVQYVGTRNILDAPFVKISTRLLWFCNFNNTNLGVHFTLTAHHQRTASIWGCNAIQDQIAFNITARIFPDANVALEQTVALSVTKNEFSPYRWCYLDTFKRWNVPFTDMRNVVRWTL